MPKSSSAIVRILVMAGTIILSQSAAISARLGLWSGWGPISGHEFEGLTVEWGETRILFGGSQLEENVGEMRNKINSIGPFQKMSATLVFW